MIEVSDVKKLGMKAWCWDMDDIPFHYFAV